MSEKSHTETSGGHAERTGIDREAHGSGTDPIVRRERRQQRLGREQVDDREKRHQRDKPQTEEAVAPSSWTCGLFCDALDRGCMSGSSR